MHKTRKSIDKQQEALMSLELGHLAPYLPYGLKYIRQWNNDGEMVIEEIELKREEPALIHLLSSLTGFD